MMAMDPSGQILMSSIIVCLTFRMILSIFLMSIHFLSVQRFFSRKIVQENVCFFNVCQEYDVFATHTF